MGKVRVMALVQDFTDSSNKVKHTRVYTKPKSNKKYYAFLAVITLIYVAFAACIVYKFNIDSFEKIPKVIIPALIVGTMGMLLTIYVKECLTDVKFIGYNKGNLLVYYVDEEGKAYDIVKVKITDSIIKNVDKKNGLITLSDESVTYDLWIHDRYDYLKTLKYIEIASSDDKTSLMVECDK